MITTTGKNILAKYLVGQAPGYASHLAFGCGPKPRTEISVGVTKKALATGVATITTSKAHGFSKGDNVFISDVDTTFNGVFEITAVPTSTSFSYLKSGSDVTEVAISPNGLATIDFSNKETLDFEMFRSPIVSRGYVTENGVSQIVFTAELPSQERYEITEVGVFSAGSNPSATSNDSKTLIAFIENENWEYHTDTQSTNIDPDPGAPLHESAATNEITTQSLVFQANASNATFTNDNRIARYERPRFLNNGIFLSGNLADVKNSANITGISVAAGKVTFTTAFNHNILVGDVVTISGVNPVNYNLGNVTVTAKTANTFTIDSSETGTYVSGGSVKLPRLYVAAGTRHVHLAGNNFSLNKNSPNDELRLAFSVVNKIGNATGSSKDPSAVRVIVEFSNSDSSVTGEYARFEVDLSNAVGSVEDGKQYLTDNRYVVVTKKLKDLEKTSAFSWSDAQYVKIYSTILDDTGASSSNFYVCLDAIRLENVSSQNSLYGLTGYSIIKNTNAQPAIKELNTSNLAEFRFALDVQ